MAADPLAGGQDRVEVVAADDMAEQQEPEQEAQPAATGDRQRHSRAVAGPYGVVPVSDEQEGEQARQLPEEGELNQVARQHNAEHRSEEHTSELQSLMRISYAVFCLKKK